MPTCQNTLIQPQKLIPRLRKFRALSGGNRALVLEALGLMAFISIGFRLLGATRTRAVLDRWADRSVRREVSPLQPTDAVRTIRATRHSLLMVKRATGIEGTCLSRSFALWTLLRRRGLQTDLQIGYRKKDGRIEGHAWLEYQGSPINEAPGVIATYTLATGTGKIWWT